MTDPNIIEALNEIKEAVSFSNVILGLFIVVLILCLWSKK